MISAVLLAAASLSGTVAIDGSSTVYPMSEAMAEDFQKTSPGVKVTVGSAGTGAGYKKFCAGEVDIADASRPIKAEEVAKCKANNIDFMELPVAYDGLTVVVNPKNSFVKSLDFAQLKKIWEPGSTVKTWHDVDPSWPNQPIHLYGPSSEHGTFDYFTEEVVGKARASRPDYNAASDTNALVSGVAGDANALGYFGYAYFQESKGKLRAIPVAKKSGGQAVAVDNQTIASGTYPLARPLFITIRKSSVERPEVDAFVISYLKSAADLAKSTSYTPLPAAMGDQSLTIYKSRTLGPWRGFSTSH